MLCIRSLGLAGWGGPRSVSPVQAAVAVVVRSLRFAPPTDLWCRSKTRAERTQAWATRIIAALRELGAQGRTLRSTDPPFPFSLPVDRSMGLAGAAAAWADPPCNGASAHAARRTNQEHMHAYPPSKPAPRLIDHPLACSLARARTHTLTHIQRRGEPRADDDAGGRGGSGWCPPHPI